MVILGSFCGISSTLSLSNKAYFVAFWISLCVAIIFTFFSSNFFPLNSAIMGFVLFCLTQSSESFLYAQFCLRDHDASIFFEHLETYFSELVS